MLEIIVYSVALAGFLLVLVKSSIYAIDSIVKFCKATRISELGAGFVIIAISTNIPPSFEYGMKIRHTSLEEFKTTEEYLKEKYHDMKSNALKILDEKKENFKTSGISISTHVQLGHPVDKITEFAVSKEIDLIIMGNTGLRGLKRIKTLGSVSRGVTENAKCPVMLVH